MMSTVLHQPMPNKLLLDISETSQTQLKSGIQRVAQALLLEFIRRPPKGYEVIPVRLERAADLQWTYVYAKEYVQRISDTPQPDYGTQPIELAAGDRCLILDISMWRLVQAVEQGLFERWRSKGAFSVAIIYDLLPLQYPQFFPPNAIAPFEEWIHAVGQLDGMISISKAVKEDFRVWYEALPGPKTKPFQQSWFHLGADFERAFPSAGLPENIEQIMRAVQERPTFLMVGTLEPRKGYLQTIAAFDLLWKRGVQINLVMVGKEGWTSSFTGQQRRTIPQIIRAIGINSQLDKQLFWLEEVSDEALALLYSKSTCVIAASEAEGFGLSLIEAAHHELPLIARDIPVFREVAGAGAFYFKGLEPQDLCAAIEQWLSLNEQHLAPSSQSIAPLSWAQSARQLWDRLIKDGPCITKP